MRHKSNKNEKKKIKVRKQITFHNKLKEQTNS